MCVQLWSMLSDSGMVEFADLIGEGVGGLSLVEFAGGVGLAE